MSDEQVSKQTAAKSERLRKRQALRAANSSAWDGNLIQLPSEKLDTSLKKNTVFMKKCRLFLKESDALVKEVQTLSLQKYLSEIIPSLVEGFTKCRTSSDFFAGVEVASALHQRFGSTFTAPFLTLFFSGIAFPTKDDLRTMSDQDLAHFLEEANQRHRMILRAIAEFWFAGLCSSTQQILEAGGDLPAYVLRSAGRAGFIPPLSVLAEILANNDENTWSSVDILLSFIKLYGDSFLGLGDDTKDEIITPEIITASQKLVQKFWAKQVKSLFNLRGDIRYAISNNEKLFLSYGTVPSSGSENLNQLQKRFAFLVPKYHSICSALNIEPKELDIEPAQDMSIAISIANFEQDSIWEELEERKFYENLPDLSYLRAKGKDSSAEHGQSSEEPSETVNDDSSPVAPDDNALILELQAIISQPASQNNIKESSQTGNHESQNNEDEDDFEADDKNSSKTKMNSNLALLLSYFLAKPSRETVDAAAQSYSDYDSSSAREAIVQKFTRDVDFRNTFQLPFIARFLAILDNMAPEITQGVVSYYLKFFSYLISKRNIKALESRRNFVITILCELTKFGLTSKMEIGSVFVLAIRSLDTPSAFIISQLLEGCGRYVVRKPKTRELMGKILFTLRSQMKVKYIEVGAKLHLENSLAYLEPIKRVEKKVKSRSPTELFIRQLVFQDLPVYGEETVFLHIKRLDWTDQATIEALEKIFIKIHKVSHSDVWNMTLLLKHIGTIHPGFRVIIVDGLLENIRRELENPSFKSNQKRVMQLQYLANMTGCNIIGCEVLLKTLHLLIAFGYKDGRPEKGNRNLLDAPDDFIRIRLVCSALSSKTIFQSQPTAKDLNALDKFVNYFLYYIFTKPKLPADVEHAVRETLGHIYPDVELPRHVFESRDELAAFLTKRSSKKDNKQQELRSESKKKLSTLDFHRGAYRLREPVVEESQEVVDLEEEKREAIIRERKATRVREQEEKAAEDEFEEEFKKLMLDRVETRDSTTSSKKLPLFSAPLPKGLAPASSIPGEQSKVKFQILTKRSDSGLKTVAVPSELNFVTSTAAEKNRLLEEQNHIAKFVLNYVRNDSESPETRGNLPQKISNTRLESTRYRKAKPSIAVLGRESSTAAAAVASSATEHGEQHIK